MKNKTRYIIISFNAIFILAVGMFVYSLLGPKNKIDAYTGNFELFKYNENWKRIDNDKNENVTLPISVNNGMGESVILQNILPNSINDGMTLCTRAEVQDIYIYIDGKLRESYSSHNSPNNKKYLTTSYVFADLTKEDAGKEIRIERIGKTKGKSKCDEITIGYGNNTWFPIICRGLPVVIAAFFMTVCGLLSVVGYVIIRKRIIMNKAVLYLGETMIVVGMWLIGTSSIKQLLFNAPYYSRIYAYLFLEIIGGFAVFYFNEVQNKKYNKIYKICACGVLAQFIINSIANYSGISIYHNTLIFSHIWMIISILIATVTISIDFKTKRIRNYLITAYGMIVFLLSCLIEVVSYYLLDFYILGVWICFGLICMLFATVVQVLHDEVKRIRDQQKHQEKMTIATIETIAGTLDAKDEYTGGHSQRVANYAMILAKAVADKYDFTQEDIDRIHYIGLMHDLGKIGVPDIILNKESKLTDKEYRLMKWHTIIGKDLLKAIDNIDGLSYGVQYHHERYDGTGYPEGLKREEIPIYARILCLADCYDAMATDRIYRKRLSDKAIREELLRCSGTQFDPYLVKIFIKLLDQGKFDIKAINELQMTNTGNILKAAIMEKKIDIYTAGQPLNEIVEPAYIRMIAYMINCAEKRGEKVQIMLVSLKFNVQEGIAEESIEGAADLLDEIVTKVIKKVDISIQYSALQRIVVLFQTEDELSDVSEKMSQNLSELDKDNKYVLEWEELSEKILKKIMMSGQCNYE